ncbi:MAG TPA: M14 metallopeptidase family protein [Blastocatellia bacterium]|nr:M14 metallopeptidase family protein [Blastocatellia bacterium]
MPPFRRLALTDILFLLLLTLLLGTATGARRLSRVVEKTGSPQSDHAGNSADGAAVKSPREFLGFAPGDDRKLADWSQVVGYFKQLASASPKVSLHEPGLTTERRPFIYALISSEQNIKNLPKIREAQRKLADPRLIASAQERERLVHETPAVVAITCSIHSTEIVASQMSMELAYRLATDNSPATQEVLRNTVLLLVPSVNPDGIDIVTEWYRKTMGTRFEGTSPPVLYHHYVGHDDNRDWFMLTQVETQELAGVLWHEWFPEIVYDVHQQGEYGSRMCMPPFFDPPNPNIDPVILREVGEIGSRMALNLTARGFKGIVTNSTYDTWWHGGLRTAPYYHNEIGILTEAASTKIATPMDIKREQLRAGVRGLPNPLVTATNYPVAWEGGVWHNSDILAMELVTTRTALEEASANREFLITNYVDAGARQVLAGKTEGPYAYVISAAQRDYPTAIRMMNILIEQGMEVHQAKSAFSAGGKTYPEGSFVILMAQPFRANAKCLFEAQHYPDRRLYAGGPAEPPYDVAGWTLPMQMGVDYEAINARFDAPLALIPSAVLPRLPVIADHRVGSTTAFYIGPETNNAFLLVNGLLKEPALYSVSRLAQAVTAGGAEFHAGGFVVELKPSAGESGKSSSKSPSPSQEAAAFLARAISLGITPIGLEAGQIPSGDQKPLRQPRLGLYRSWVPSMDEGWTRWILEQFGFEYATVTDRDIRSGDLNSHYDVIVMPDQTDEQIVKGNKADSYPAEYTGGIGDDGVGNLKKFVEAGGVLVCLNTASELALRRFDPPVKNVLDGLRTSQFYAPGSIFRATVDSKNPIGFGMPSDADLYFVSGIKRESERPNAPTRPSSETNSPVRSALALLSSSETLAPLGNNPSPDPSHGQSSDIPVNVIAGLSQSTSPARRGSSSGEGSEERTPSVSAFAFDVTDPARARSVADYVGDNPLRSGWLLGPNYITKHSALVEADMGKGRLVLFGFRPQHRAQTWGTFKFLFNSIYLGQSR